MSDEEPQDFGIGESQVNPRLAAQPWPNWRIGRGIAPPSAAPRPRCPRAGPSTECRGRRETARCPSPPTASLAGLARHDA